MLDGAIMNIANVQKPESKTNLGLRHDKAPSMKKDKDFGSTEKDSSFQQDLKSKMDKRDRHEDKAPQKEKLSASNSRPQERENVNANQQRPKSQEPMRAEHPRRPERVNASQRMEQEDIPKEMNVNAMENSLLLWNQAQQNDPVLKFMDSMENKFGIEPERLIEAFGGLSDAQLMQSPEESMEAYLKQLNIPDGDMENAKDMYSKLLTDMRFKKVEKQDNTKLVPMELQSALSEMTELKDPVAMEKSSIADLNKKFFDVYPNQFGRPMQDDKPMAADLGGKSFMPNAEGQFEEVLPEAPMMPKQPEGKLNDAPVMSTEDALWANSIQQRGAQQEESSSVLPGLGLAANAATEGMDAPDADVPEWLSKLNDNNQVEVSSDSVSLNAEHSSDHSGEGESSQQGESQNPNGMIGDNNANKTQSEKFAKILATGGAAEASKADGEAEGVESIVKNVQLLSKKGGGEMKVQLNQDGLGEMQLKVAVNEGKVNVQMLTDNKDAKKLIESDLGALKVELGEKKIELNDIKVEVAKDMKNQLDQQMADQRREETRQFWQQFRQENEAKRAMAMNMGLTSYQAKDPNSIEDRQPQDAAYRSSQLSTKLDIVA